MRPRSYCAAARRTEPIHTPSWVCVIALYKQKKKKNVDPVLVSRHSTYTASGKMIPIRKTHMSAVDMAVTPTARGVFFPSAIMHCCKQASNTGAHATELGNVTDTAAFAGSGVLHGQMAFCLLLFAFFVELGRRYCVQ